MKILSHRGFHRGANIHENTHAAFERALNFGVDGIETDIRLSADLQPILFHDRVAANDSPVDSLTRQQLEKIAGHEIPTLDEILARWPDVFWNLEIKCSDAMPVAIGLVKRHSRPDRIFLSSFRHDIVAQCAQQLQVACGLLLAHCPLDVAQLLQPWLVHSRVRTIVWDFNVIDPHLIKQAHREGFQVFVYGPVTPNEHQQCRDWGLDGVITDYPPRARGG